MMRILRDQCERRLAGLKAVRQPYEAEWKEISRLAQPRRSRFLASDTNRNRKRGPALFDSHGIQAFRTLTAGMTSGLSSPSRPWKTLRTYDDAINDDPEIKAWLDQVDKRIDSFLARTNFYGAVKTGYAEMGLFGTEACVMLEHWREGAVCHALTAGEYWIGLSDAMVPDTLYRMAPMSVKQAIEAFGDDASRWIRDCYDRGDHEVMVETIHAIEPNPDHDPRRRDAQGKAFRSVWWDVRADRGSEAVLRVSGYDEQPFWAPRWDTTGADSWGTSPGMEALPDLRELQMQAKRKGEATDWVIKPEKIAPATLRLKNQPGSIVAASDIDAARVIIPYQVPYQAIQLIGDDVERCRQSIDRAAYADLFMAITNMQGIQPRNVEEIASRNEEKLTQLGPVIERVNNEKLEVAINRTFGIMMRGRLLPPPPAALQGRDLRIHFVSILTQLQRSIGVGQIQETISFVGNLAGMDPQALDMIDMDAAVREFADRKGAPAILLRTPKAVAAIRAQRAQSQQAQQLAQNAGNFRDAAEGARLLSETARNGGTGLAGLLGVPAAGEAG